MRLSTFGLVGGSGGLAGAAGLVFAGFSAAGFSAAGLAAILLGADGFVSAVIGGAAFLGFASPLRVAFSAGLTAAALPAVADLVLLEATAAPDSFDKVDFEVLLGWSTLDGLALDGPFWATEPFDVPVFVAGLVVFDLASGALMALLVDFPFSADLDLLDATTFAAELFLATDFDGDPFVKGFFAAFLAGFLVGLFAGFGVAFPLPTFLGVGFSAVFFFDALATAFTNHC